MWGMVCGVICLGVDVEGVCVSFRRQGKSCRRDSFACVWRCLDVFGFVLLCLMCLHVFGYRVCLHVFG